RKLEVFDSGVVALNDPDAFALGAGAIRFQVWPVPDTANSQVTRRPDRDVPRIRLGANLDDVPIFGSGCCLAGTREFLAGAHRQNTPACAGRLDGALWDCGYR